MVSITSNLGGGKDPIGQVAGENLAGESARWPGGGDYGQVMTQGVAGVRDEVVQGYIQARVPSAKREAGTVTIIVWSPRWFDRAASQSGHDVANQIQARPGFRGPAQFDYSRVDIDNL